MSGELRRSDGLRHGLFALLVLLISMIAAPADAHEFRPGLLRLEQRAETEGSGRFDLRLVAPQVSTAGPIPEGELRPIVPEHCVLTARSVIAFNLDCGAQGLVGSLGVAGLDRHPIDVLVDIRYADATRVTAVLGPDQRTFAIDGTDQARGSVFVEYLQLGVEHILLGFDHLLFVLGLVLLVRTSGRWVGRLLATVTAFTLAHSVTLAASALEFIELPSAPVEAAIALSILLLARELALGIDGQATDTLTWRFPWLVAFGFGLLHGFGFAGALREIGLPASRTPLALLAFNLGVEAGQLAVVALLLLVIAMLKVRAKDLERHPRLEHFARRIPIWVMGAIAFAWTLERVLGFWGPSVGI